MKKAIILMFFMSTLIFAITQEQSAVLELVNKERAKFGLTALLINPQLNELAQIRSNDMYENKYFSHNSPVYGTPFDLIRSYNIKYMTAGENIAKGQKTPEKVVKSWMNSEGHRKNILNPKFEEMGISRDSYDENIWTQIFIGK